MKNIYKNKTFLFIFMFAASMLGMLVVSQGNAFAATKTWTGATDNNFSEGTNWSPAGAPVAGDDLVFDTGTVVPNYEPVNDIVGLSVLSITFTGSGITGTNAVNTTTPLTVTGSISDSASVTSVTHIYGEIIIGGNVTVRGVSFDDSTPGYIDLNGNNMTIASALGTPFINSYEVPITGNGGLIIDAPGTDIQFYAANTYSGTTTYRNGDLLTLTLTPNQVFGTSSITIDPDASLSLRLDPSFDGQSWDNPITIAATDQTAWQDGYNALFFSSSSPISISVPNITLLSNARMSSLDVNVNLAGINAGTFCIEYGSFNEFDQTFDAGSVFSNGPDHCVLGAAETVSNTATPGTPNTGFGLIRNNPIATMAITTLAAITIAAVARQRIKANKA